MVAKHPSLFNIACIGLALISGFAVAALAQKAGVRGPKNLQPNDVAVPIDHAALQRQYSLLAAMSLQDIEYNENNLVRLMKGDMGITVDNHKMLKAGDVPRDVATKLKPFLLTTGTETLTVRRNYPVEHLGIRSIHLIESIGNIPVMVGSLTLIVGEETGEVLQLASSVIPDRGLPRTPKVTADAAKKLAALFLESAGFAEPKSAIASDEPLLAYFAGTSKARVPTLIWVVTVDYLTANRPPPAPQGGTPGYVQVFIDAMDGTYLDQIAASLHAGDRATAGLTLI